MDPTLTTLLGIVVVLVTGASTAFFTRRKTSADTAEVLTGTAMRLVEQMEKRITDLENRLSRAEERERLALERERLADTHISELNMQLRNLREQLPPHSQPTQFAVDTHPLEVHLVHEPAQTEVST